MPKPQTATVKLEITNDDGSKTVVTTAELDATRLVPNRFTDPTDAPEHVVIGMRNPFYDESDYFQRQDRFLTQTSLKMREPDTHFFLNLQMPALDPHSHVYTIQELEAPLKRVVAYYNQKTKRVQIANYTESDAEGLNIQDTASKFKDSIYFFLDIP